MSIARFNSAEQFTEQELESISILGSHCNGRAEGFDSNSAAGPENQELVQSQDQSTFTSISAFNTWFVDIQVEMEKGQNDGIKSYLANLEQSKSQLLAILSGFTSARDLLQDLDQNLKFVTSKTEGLQNACEQLLNEQKHLTAVADDIAHKLLYFNELEPISKALNEPGEVLVKDPGFIQMLQKLDQCLAFVSDHVN